MAANWAEPANTNADITIGATSPITGSARTPNEIPTSSPATATQIAARAPAAKLRRGSASAPEVAASVRCVSLSPFTG